MRSLDGFVQRALRNVVGMHTHVHSYMHTNWHLLLNVFFLLYLKTTSMFQKGYQKMSKFCKKIGNSIWMFNNHICFSKLCILANVPLLQGRIQWLVSTHSWGGREGIFLGTQNSKSQVLAKFSFSEELFLAS